MDTVGFRIFFFWGGGEGARRSEIRLTKKSDKNFPKFDEGGAGGHRFRKISFVVFPFSHTVDQVLLPKEIRDITCDRLTSKTDFSCQALPVGATFVILVILIFFASVFVFLLIFFWETSVPTCQALLVDLHVTSMFVNNI